MNTAKDVTRNDMEWRTVKALRLAQITIQDEAWRRRCGHGTIKINDISPYKSINKPKTKQ